MKRYKVREIIKMLEKDHWYLKEQTGSHRQFRHPTKKGRVTINGKPSDTLGQELLNSIFKQAGWR
jgi:predicted RNA binding protein YcfA (HicA-like mRNA interferase family)